MTYKLVLLPGDGIGPEVMEAAVRVMHRAADLAGIKISTESRLIGGAAYDAQGTALHDDTVSACKDSDAVLLGAVGGYKWEDLPHDKKPEAGLLRIRKELELFANIRPARVFDDFLDASSLKNEVLKGTDFVVFRELTGGIYFGQPRGFDGNRGWNTMVYEKHEVERIARKAFEAAMLRGKKLLSVDKANVLEVSQFWRNTVAALAADYPEVQLQTMYVDNCAMQIVRDPRQFDVIVTSNMFGDIISDIAGQITGSLGMLPSASLGEEHALYEPVHGSAPDIAGQGIANPIAMISSVAMLFTYSFGLPEMACMIEGAVENTLKAGFRTKEIWSEGKTLVNTEEMTDRILQAMTEGSRIEESRSEAGV